MENMPLLVAYLLTWAGYVFVLHAYAWKLRMSHLIILASQAAPSVIALTMTYIFLIRRGATVAQFVAGSSEGMALWSLWANLWPVFFFGSLIVAGAHALWFIGACVEPGARRWIPVAVASAAICVFAFFAVACNFPDA